MQQLEMTGPCRRYHPRQIVVSYTRHLDTTRLAPHSNSPSTARAITALSIARKETHDGRHAEGSVRRIQRRCEQSHTAAPDRRAGAHPYSQATFATAGAR